MLVRHAVLSTPPISLRLSQLSCYSRNKQSSFHSPYTLPSSVSRKSFACHSCENCRGVYQQFPFRNSRLSTRHCIQVLSSHTLAHSFATTKKSTPFLSIVSALFVKKHPGWGVPCGSYAIYICYSGKPKMIASVPRLSQNATRKRNLTS
jgi:hypothetical protein